MYGKYSTRVCVERLIQHEAKPSAYLQAECCICLETPPEYCTFRTHKQGGALNVILYFLVVWLRVIISSTLTAAIFSDKDISKCLTNLFLAIERTNRISLASFSNLQCHAHDQSCCLGGVMFKKLRDQTISKCIYNLCLAVEQTRRISFLAIYSVLFT